MPPIYDIYERKNYRNRILLAHAVTFELEVRETKLHIQAESDLSAKAKDAILPAQYKYMPLLRKLFDTATFQVTMRALRP
jgi:hypothetical protein